METIIAKILTGGCRHDTSPKHKDVDYLTIVEEEITHKRYFDRINKIDYLCYGKKFIEKLLKKEETHFNLPFILLDLMNQTEYKVEYDVLKDIDYVKKVYKNWITKNDNAILKCIPMSKRLFYPFVLMYYVKNNGYFLTEEQQKNVNKVHQREAIDENIINEFILFYELDKGYLAEMKSLQNRYTRKNKTKF